MAEEETEGVAVESGDVEEKAERLDLKVEISETGPCQKHLKVIIPRAEVDRFFEKEFSDLVKTAAVPGFRPGKTPRRLIERRYRKDVAAQVKAGLLMQSFEQVFEDEKIDPLDEPDVDVQGIELPEEGDFIYEFDVEVRPEFDLPDYKSLQLKKPVREFTDEDVEKGLQKFLRSRGAMSPKEGVVAEGDYINADVRFLHDGQVLREFSDLLIRVDKELYFKDGRIAGFAQGVVGASVGDTREFKVELSDSVGREELRGKEADAVFVIQQVKELILPELNEELFDRIGVSDEAELRDVIRSGLEHRLAYDQKQALAEQIVEKLLESVDFQLPPALLRRQADRTLRRMALELQAVGFSQEEIQARANVLRQNSAATTAKSLKRQFILQKIAEVEEITVDQDDLEAAVVEFARRSGESYRRVRARIEQEQLWEGVALQVLEDKAISKIASYASVEEVPWVEEEIQSTGLDASAVPESESPSAASESESDSESGQAE